MTGARNEHGIALITVLVVLASMALLMAGVFSLVSEGSRSANDHMRFETARATGESGLEQIAALIDRVNNPNFNPPAPPGYGVTWSSRANFGDYLRGHSQRSGDASAPSASDCRSGVATDIDYTADTDQGQVRVRACVLLQYSGTIAGSGQGQVFARTSQGTADDESMLEVTVWVSGPQQEVSTQYRATVRAFH